MAQQKRTRPPLIIAHRGGAGEALENSLAAFRHAMRVGCHSLEADLRATRDGEIILMHDATLDRTTRGKGKIRNFILKQLKTIRLKNGESIPTLEELLKLTQNKISLHLEIKESNFEKKLVETIKRHRATKTVYMVSFHAPVLVKIHELHPELITGFIFDKTDSLNQAPDFCSLLLPNAKLLNPKFLVELKRRKKHIHAWTVNRLEEAKQCLNAGIHGLITDRPTALFRDKK